MLTWEGPSLLCQFGELLLILQDPLGRLLSQPLLLILESETMSHSSLCPINPWSGFTEGLDLDNPLLFIPFHSSYALSPASLRWSLSTPNAPGYLLVNLRIQLRYHLQEALLEPQPHMSK